MSAFVIVALPARLFVMDLMISMDVSANPCPVNSEITISPRRLSNGIADLNSPDSLLKRTTPRLEDA